MTNIYLNENVPIDLVEDYEADEVFVGICFRFLTGDVTFWGTGDIRGSFKKALDRLDNYYKERDNAFARLHRGSGPDVA